MKNDGRSLEFVEEQTKEICIEALKNDGKSLEYVEDNIIDTKYHLSKNSKTELYM